MSWNHDVVFVVMRGRVQAVCRTCGIQSRKLDDMDAARKWMGLHTGTREERRRATRDAASG